MKQTQMKKYGDVVAANLFIAAKLDELGVASNYIGYYYLIDIFEITINGQREVKSYSREIFPIVSQRFDKTTCTVERNIRVLINKCWNMEMSKKLKYFYNENIKPTCCQFIALIKSYILSYLM